MRKLHHVLWWVVGFAVVLTGLATIQRRERFLQVMAAHEARRRHYEALSFRLNPLGIREDSRHYLLTSPAGLRALPVTFPAPDTREQALTWYHFELQEKYRQAAQRPWATVDPDPAPPSDELADH